MTSITAGSTVSPCIARALTRFSIHIGITAKVKIGIKSEGRLGENTGSFFDILEVAIKTGAFMEVLLYDQI